MASSSTNEFTITIPLDSAAESGSLVLVEGDVREYIRADQATPDAIDNLKFAEPVASDTLVPVNSIYSSTAVIGGNVIGGMANGTGFYPITRGLVTTDRHIVSVGTAAAQTVYVVNDPTGGTSFTADADVATVTGARYTQHNGAAGSFLANVTDPSGANVSSYRIVNTTHAGNGWDIILDANAAPLNGTLFDFEFPDLTVVPGYDAAWNPTSSGMVEVQANVLVSGSAKKYGMVPGLNSGTYDLMT